jgi:catechol 2,3-dioxygenase-like lactoylglutathione lyase family enzyme
VKILGPDTLIFGVEDLAACVQCVTDYGLQKIESSASGARFEALDGTGLEIRKAGDASLAPAIAAAPNIRETIYGVADKQTLDAIGAELSRDRAVKVSAGNVLHSTDDDGYPIGFQVTARRPVKTAHLGINVPGKPPGRALNVVAAVDGERPAALALSHLVLFTKDKVKSEKFYAERLGFRTVDVFTNLGPFMRPQGTNEHHTLFLIQAPVVGVQHFTFHFAGMHEMLKAGWEFQKKGYKSFWGPGRHIFGSNYFWYFNSPFGGLIELDADMDLHDDNWKPRHVLASADSSQTFLLQWAEKWTPGPGPGGKH